MFQDKGSAGHRIHTNRTHAHTRMYAKRPATHSHTHTARANAHIHCTHARTYTPHTHTHTHTNTHARADTDVSRQRQRRTPHTHTPNAITHAITRGLKDNPPSVCFNGVDKLSQVRRSVYRLEIAIKEVMVVHYVI